MEKSREIKGKSILRLISGGSNLRIEALDGKEYIAGSKISLCDSTNVQNFEGWGLNQAGSETPETLFDVTELVGYGTFKEIYLSISNDLEKIVMSQHQIIRFCEKYSEWLRSDTLANYFLIKVKGVYFVISLYMNSSRDLSARVYPIRLEFLNGPSGNRYHRFITPRLRF